MDDFAARAGSWLDARYSGVVELDGIEPIRATERSVPFGCRYAAAREPMPAATICVPTDGAEPFPVANSHSLDERFNLSRTSGLGEPQWRWRANARNCVVAADAALDDHPASVLPWRPGDESPGWWNRIPLAGGSPRPKTERDR